jgi:hypothetical protein
VYNVAMARLPLAQPEKTASSNVKLAPHLGKKR